MRLPVSTSYGLVMLSYEDNPSMLPSLIEEKSKAYPEFEKWFQDKVIGEKRPILKFFCQLQTPNGLEFEELGFVILKLCSDRSVKICTMHLDPKKSNATLLATLLELTVRFCSGFPSIRLTVPRTKLRALNGTIAANGFKVTGIQPRQDRGDEIVFVREA